MFRSNTDIIEHLYNRKCLEIIASLDEDVTIQPIKELKMVSKTGARLHRDKLNFDALSFISIHTLIIMMNQK